MQIDKINARIGIDGLSTQSLMAHLTDVSEICDEFLVKFPCIAKVLGYAHDLGKACSSFQIKLQNNGIERVDHSSAGAIFILSKCKDYALHINTTSQQDINCAVLVLQMCAFVTSCHHTGLRDMVDNEESQLDNLLGKLENAKYKVTYDEVMQNGKEICDKLTQIIYGEQFIAECSRLISGIVQNHQNGNDANFYLGMYLRYFYSILIDADRTDAYNFDRKINYKNHKVSTQSRFAQFELIASELDKKIASYPHNELNNIRNKIYQTCIKKARSPDRLFNLNVQTGGGKTFASFRFALEKLQYDKLARIIYVVPYISIIEQNAESIRKVLNPLGLDKMLVESHSNAVQFADESVEYHSGKFDSLLCTWNEPIIFTTMVSFLESIYGGSTQNNRRFHNLANSVIIFDEIQNLPINCIGLFNLLVKFLTQDLHTTVVLCTATQPVLDKLSTYDSLNSRRKILELPESVPLIEENYPVLKRTQIITDYQSTEMNKEQACSFVLKKLETNKHILFVVNTKKAARELFLVLKKYVKSYHLSTNLCPQHRLDIINQVKVDLQKDDKFVLVSTQLIEAGVDLDFECVIRSKSGLESIIQSAGRCNREGKLCYPNGAKKLGEVYVVKLSSDLESLKYLPDIYERVNKYNITCHGQEDLMSRDVIERYFKALYGSVSNEELQYIINETNAVDLLINTKEKIFSPNNFNYLKFRFGTVSQNFKVISNDQVGVLVPYKNGQEYIQKLINDGNFMPKDIERYMVNVYTNKISNYSSFASDTGVWYSYNYDTDLGLVVDEGLSLEFEGGLCS